MFARPRQPLSLIVASISVVAACGASRDKVVGDDPIHDDDIAVGTYIGGGSFIVGDDHCTYEARTPGVFSDGDDAKPGPRFVVAPGKIFVRCPKTTLSHVAVVPTGAAIEGPTKIHHGDTQATFASHLAAGGHELRGEAALDWKLGGDCAGHATFAPVLGAQDTGGPDRSRTLVTTGPGTCTIELTLTTGSEVLVPKFAPQTFRATQHVTID